MSDETRVWIAKRKTTGKTTYRLRWIDPAAGKWRSRAVGTDRRVAQQEAARLEDELHLGTYRDITRITWADFVKDHVGKIQGNRDAIEAQHTLSEFGELLHPVGPKGVTYPMIEAYVAFLKEDRTLEDGTTKKGNKPATVNKKLRYIRAALNRAIKRGFMARSPMDTELFQAVEHKRPRIATQAEETALLDAADTLYGFRVRTFVYAALNTGGRRGELLSLPWERIELDGGERHVHFAKTKSHRDRVVPINPDLAGMLHRLMAQTLEVGGPFIGIMVNVNQMWTRIVKTAGVPKISMHDLRRTFVTRLVRAGVPMPTVQKLAGHAAIQTTLPYYNWVGTEDLQAGIHKLQRGAGCL